MIKKFSQHRLLALTLCMIACAMTVAGAIVIKSISPTKAATVIDEKSITITLDDGQGTVYDAGTNAPFTISINLSGMDEADTLINPVLTLNYNTANLGTTTSTRPTIVASDAPSYWHKSKTIAYPTVTWKLSDIQGGSQFTLPGTIKMPAGATPNGYPLALTATITSDNKEPLTTEITIDWKTANNQPAKRTTSSSLGTYNGLSSWFEFGGLDADSNGFIDADKTYPVVYYWTNTQPSNYRTTVPNTYTIVDHLPQGATFDSAENPGWIYDEATHTATYDTTAKAIGTSSGINLVLRFPNAPVNTNLLNKSEVTYYVSNPRFDDPESYTVDADCYVKLSGAEAALSGLVSKYAIPTQGGSSSQTTALRPAVPYQISGDYWWRNTISNTLKMTDLTNLVIGDNTLDSHLKFTRFFVIGPLNGADITIEYREAGSNEWKPLTTITNNQLIYSSFTDTGFANQLGNRNKFLMNNYIISSNQKVSSIIDLPNDVVVDGVRAFVDKLNIGESYSIYLCSEWRDPAFASTINPSTTSSFQNTTNFKADNGLNTNKAAIHSITPYAPYVFADDSGTNMSWNVNSYGTKYLGDIFTLSNEVAVSGLDESDSIDMNGAQIIHLLPTGVEYIPGSVTFSGINNTTAVMFRQRLVQIEPDIIYDYKGTGKTALIWTMQGTYQREMNWTDYSLIRMNYQVKILETCQKGTSTFEHYVTWSENARIPGQRKTNQGIYYYYSPNNDTLDLDNDGNISEKFLSNNPTFIYNPPQAVVATKGVKGSCNSTFLYSPALGYGLENSEASYKLSIMNYCAYDVNRVKLIDVLPYVGDKALVKDGNGSYVDRGSQFAVMLTGAVVINDAENRFDIYYSKTPPANPWDGVDNYDTSADWLTAAQIGSGWAEVRAFKVVLKDGEKLTASTGVDVIAAVKVPDNLPMGSVAYNSFAIASGVGTYGPWLEAVKSGLEIVNYDVSITKTADKAVYSIRDTITYTIVVKNTTKITATGAYVVDTIPADITYVRCSRDAVYDPGTRELKVNIGTLAANSTIQFTITATADTPKEVVVNTAAVTINEEEKDYKNNKDAATIRIVDPTKGGIIHLRQFIRYPDGSLQPADLPEAYVHIVGGNSYNEWTKFNSKLDNSANYALKEYYDIVPVPLDNTYAANVLIPQGYKLVSVTVSNTSESSQAAGISISLSQAKTEGWVTIVLEKLPTGGLDQKIVNNFPPLE